MCLTALDEASVLTMTCVNVRRSGLVKAVPSSLVDLSTIVLVGARACHFPHLTFYSQPFPKSVVKLVARLLIADLIFTSKTFSRSWALRSLLQVRLRSRLGWGQLRSPSLRRRQSMFWSWRMRVK